MTIEHLRYFIALADQRNFRAASELCNISQPALSQAIIKMEESLGCALINRTRKPLVLTEKGSVFYHKVKEILHDYNELLIEISVHESGSKKLRIGIIPTLAPYLLPLFLGDFIEHNPDLHIQIQDLTTDEIIEKIKDDDIDVGILALPIEEKNTIQEGLFYEEFLAYSKKELDYNFLSPKDIDPDDLWILEEGHCFRNQVMQLCDLENKSSDLVQYQSNEVETLLNLVDAYKGITIVPELATLKMKRDRKNRLYPFEEPVPVRNVGIVYHRFNIKKSEIEIMKAAILKNLPGFITTRNKTQHVLDIT